MTGRRALLARTTTATGSTLLCERPPRDERRGGGAGRLSTTRLFRNRQGRFTDVTEETGAGVALRGQGCVAADLDDDGHTDLYAGRRSQHAALERRRGVRRGGRGPPRGPSAGTRAPLPATSTATGGPTVVSGYVDEATRIPEATQGFPNTYAGRRDLLFLNEGDRSFREVGREAGLEVVRFGYGLGVVLADFERDGDLDVHLANDTNPNRLYENVPWPGERPPTRPASGSASRSGRQPRASQTPARGWALRSETGTPTGGPTSSSRTRAARATRSTVPTRLTRTTPRSPGRTRRRRDRPRALHRWGSLLGGLDNDTDLDLVLVNGYIPVTNLQGDAERIQVFRNLLAEGAPGRSEEAPGAGMEWASSSRGAAQSPTTTTMGISTSLSCRSASRSFCSRTAARLGGSRSRSMGCGGRRGNGVTLDGTKLRRAARRLQLPLVRGPSAPLRARVTRARSPEVRVRWPGGEETVVENVEANQALEVDAP